MVNWMVAVDGSAHADWAFRKAVEMIHPERDHLFIVWIVEKLTEKHYAHSASLYSVHHAHRCAERPANLRCSLWQAFSRAWNQLQRKVCIVIWTERKQLR